MSYVAYHRHRWQEQFTAQVPSVRADTWMPCSFQPGLLSLILRIRSARRIGTGQKLYVLGCEGERRKHINGEHVSVVDHRSAGEPNVLRE